MKLVYPEACSRCREPVAEKCTTITCGSCGEVVTPESMVSPWAANGPLLVAVTFLVFASIGLGFYAAMLTFYTHVGSVQHAKEMAETRDELAAARSREAILRTELISIQSELQQMKEVQSSGRGESMRLPKTK